MPWCVRSLKIVGEGLVEVSSVCSHEFDLGHFEDFLVIDSKEGDMIKILIFSRDLFKMKFFGGKTSLYTMYFVKIKQGRIDWMSEEDDRIIIAEEYAKRTGETLRIVRIYELPPIDLLSI